MRSLSLSASMLAIFGLIAAVPVFSQEPPSETPAPEVQPGQAAAEKPVHLSDSARIALCRKKTDQPLEPAETPPATVEGNATRPVIIYHRGPSYSSSGAEGVVIVQAVINQDGCTRQVKILRGVGKKVDAAALEAVRQWVFRPATLGGKPISVHYVLTVNFSH